MAALARTRMTTDSEQLAQETYLRVQTAVGEVTMAFSKLDELMRDIITQLVNPQKRDVGFVVYDMVANSHDRKVDLLKTLMRVKFNATGLLGKHEPFLAQLPDEYNRFMELCGRIKGLSEQRNRTIHDVYQCWIGADGVRMERSDLRKGHENLLVVQPGSRAQVTPEDIHMLAKEVFDLARELAEITRKLIVPTA
jgi:hypothetical protein